MKRRVFDIVEEPRGNILQRLMHALGQQASGVLLVLRDGLDLAESGQALLEALSPHLLERKRGSSWPGTTLLTEEATLLRFELGESVLHALIGASEGLYGWQQPRLPEDLAFLRADGTAMLASIAHERDAYLEITDEELDGLTQMVPELATMTRLQRADE